MKAALLLILAALFFIVLLSGCTENQAEDFNVAEAPGIRITAEAMEVINNRTEVYNLSYTERAS